MSTEHTIWIVQRTINQAIVPVCWRHTQAEAEAVANMLRDELKARVGYPHTYFFVLPVTDSIQRYNDDAVKCTCPYVLQPTGDLSTHETDCPINGVLATSAR